MYLFLKVCDLSLKLLLNFANDNYEILNVFNVPGSILPRLKYVNKQTNALMNKQIN